MRPNVNETVTLHTPENARLHGARATVIALEPWGAFVRTDAAATGQYRAAWEEMLPAGLHLNGSASKTVNASGDCCDHCGSFRMVRAGACLCCLDCGTSGGCS